MTLIVTDAVVLHATDYLETSRIYRLATREAGVQSVLGRGARTSRKRFGSALDLFAQGTAQIQVKPGRELHTLALFDVTRVRPELAADLGRFAAASALAECVMRVVHEEAAPRVYDAVTHGFDLIAGSPPDRTVPVALGAVWRLVSETGFTPTLDRCANCHAPIPSDDDAMFSHLAGGVLCPACGARAPGGRRLPGSARRTIGRWLAADERDPAAVAPLSPGEARAHQRLLREFLTQHLTDARALRAFAAWEQDRLAEA
jgi:DNA repair protein RecO (recombination protein O)